MSLRNLSTVLVATFAACTNAMNVFDTNTTLPTSNAIVKGENDLDGIAMYVQPLSDAFVDTEVKLNGHVPNYIKGDLVNACPSLFKVGKYELSYFMDGFFRYNRYRIDGNTLKFSSKIVDDNKFYTASMKHQEPQDMLFDYPVPKRTADRVPGITMNWCGAKVHQCDNIGIMPWQLPDGQMVFTTDSPDFLKFNVDTLATEGYSVFKDDFKTLTLGTTHIVEDIKTGDTIGVVTEMYNKALIKSQNCFYRITAANPTERKRIGCFHVDDLYYYHSFGHSTDYLSFPQSAVTMSTVGLMAGHPMKQNFLIHPKKNAKMIIMKIADGTYETYDLGHYAFILHTGNAYVENDIYSVYHPTYIGSEDPFEFQSFNFFLNPDRTNVSPKNEFRRYDINMKTKEVTYETIITMTKDVVDFPIINPTWYGKKNCFTWVSELLFSQGSTAILKIDHCHGQKITRWEEPGVWVSEPFFVDDPTTKTEDAGTIMVSVFDQKLNKNRMIMINAQSMHTSSDTVLPTRIPETLHQGWYPKK